MIGNYPITWVISDALSLILFSLCLIHALNHEDSKHRVLELCCFTIGSTIFEHFGVKLLHYFSYDQHRLMMIGVVPLGVILTEAVIVYAAFRLFEHLNMPKWTSIWVIGFFAMLQDMSYDPVGVHDTYLYNGAMSGQWNWAFQYDGTYFGIPFYNFTGWLLFCGIYPALTLLGRHIYKKTKNEIWGYSYSFISGLILIVPVVLLGAIFSSGDRNMQLIKMIANGVFAIALMAIYWKKMTPINLKKDMIILIVPIVLRLYDIVVCFSLKLQEAYVPVIVCSIVHFVYLAIIFAKAKKNQVFHNV